MKIDNCTFTNNIAGRNADIVGTTVTVYNEKEHQTRTHRLVEMTPSKFDQMSRIRILAHAVLSLCIDLDIFSSQLPSCRITGRRKECFGSTSKIRQNSNM